MMKNSLASSLRVFAPILVLILPPALILALIGLLNILLAVSSDSISISSAIQFSLWGFSPILFSLLLIGSGAAYFQRCQSRFPHRAVQVVLWVIFTTALFLVLWFDITLVGSISASDKPPAVYLRTTALMAAAFTGAGQILSVPWLRSVFRRFPELTNPDRERTADHEI